MNIALVAHDARKHALIEWVEFNAKILAKHDLICTGTTGRLVEQALNKSFSKKVQETFYLKNVYCLKSGPLGGDQQMGAMISEGRIDLLIFLVDNLSMQAHDSDIKALSRLAQLYNIPFACNRATADYLISSPLFNSDYQPIKPDFSTYLNRNI